WRRSIAGVAKGPQQRETRAGAVGGADNLPGDLPIIGVAKQEPAKHRGAAAVDVIRERRPLFEAVPFQPRQLGGDRSEREVLADLVNQCPLVAWQREVIDPHLAAADMRGNAVFPDDPADHVKTEPAQLGIDLRCAEGRRRGWRWWRWRWRAAAQGGDPNAPRV